MEFYKIGQFSRKISDANDVNIVKFAWRYVPFDPVKVRSVKCCRLAVGEGGPWAAGASTLRHSRP